MIRFLLLQITAHTISDFYLQTDKSCADKLQYGFKSRQLYLHALITFVCSWFLSFSLDFWWLALIIGVTHLLVDAIKCHVSKWKYAFVVDQFIHLIVIAVVCHFCNCCLPNCLDCIEAKYIALVLGALICVKPSNIFIKEIIKAANIKVSKESEAKTEDLPNAGKLIGIVERLLSLVFVLLGQYEAVGFILAAKSILRFAEGDKAKSEYVLIGTLLSFSIAVFIGVAIKLYFY